MGLDERLDHLLALFATDHIKNALARKRRALLRLQP